jgi:hypothetical protein
MYLPSTDGLRDIHVGAIQPLFESLKVGRSGDDDGALARNQPSTDESCQRIEEDCVGVIDLRYVLARGDFTPKDRGSV